jgi:6-phosphofructokinase 1
MIISDGRLICVRNGRYDHVPIGVVTSSKKLVDVAKFYHTERLRPIYERFEAKPLMIMTSDY